MTEQESSAKQGKGFFTVALSLIDDMVKQSAGAEELMAYLVLARGAGKRKSTSWSANACAKHTGLTYYRANEAIGWLEQQGYISKSEHFAADNLSKKSKPKWTFKTVPDEDELALANPLVDGIGAGRNNPPLMRIDEIGYSKHGRAAARLDALMVLLHLYRHQLLADFGGINPRAGIYRSWEKAESSQGETQTDLTGTNAAIYEITGSSSQVYTKFAAEALFYVDDSEERHERFWDAFHNLQKMGWLYETTQIWSADPSQNNKAEPLYTLYIHDHHASQSDPSLSKIIHSTAFRTGSMDAYSQFSSHLDSDDILQSGRFRYVANKKTGGFPIGIYRLRFRPWTRDTGIGIEREQQRFKHWSEALSGLPSH